MFENLYKYLVQNKKLSFPNIGTFIIEHQLAELDFVNKVLHAPLPVVRFTANEIEVDTEKSIDEANEIKNICAKKGSVYVQGIGNLKKENADYFFEPESSLQQYFPDIIVERIVRKDAEHTIRVGEEERTNTEMQQFLAEEKIVKDKWWAYVIVLALLGIIALIIYNIIR